MSLTPGRKAQLLAVFGALAIALAPGARSGSIPQLLTLGPVTVLNGTAIVSGTGKRAGTNWLPATPSASGSRMLIGMVMRSASTAAPWRS